MLLQPQQNATQRTAGVVSMGSYVVLAILLVAVLLLGIYPAFLMSLLQTVAVSV
jgi:NADH:ubiquinone oxidoreductase subunit 4 (subunit M)